MSKKWVLTAFLCGSLAAGCGHEAPSRASDGPFQQALNYAKCVRANGVPDFPDPQQDGKGGIRQDGGNTDTPAARKALEACRDKMPQGEANGGRVDSAKLAAWTKCMRSKGLPNFPDPDVSGGSFTVSLTGTGISGNSPAFESAMRACQSHFPGGTMKLENRQ
jgi:hypothetical protein